MEDANKKETFVQLHRDLLLSRIFRIVSKQTDYKPELEDALSFDAKLKKFVPVKIRRRKSETISYAYEVGRKKYAYQFSCFEILNETDARVLCAVGALASAKFGEAISMNDGSEATKKILDELNHEGVRIAPEQNCVPYRVETSCKRILKSLGMDVAGENIEAVKRSLERLSKVHVKIETYDSAKETLSQVSFNLMTYAQITKPESGQNTLSIVFNAVTAQSLLGSLSGSIYIRTKELEKLALAKSGTKLLHFRLCAQIKPGSTETFYGETLESYLWKETDDRKTKYKRRNELKKAIEGLEAIGWTGKAVNLKNGPGWQISRPAEQPAIEHKENDLPEAR